MSKAAPPRKAPGPVSSKPAQLLGLIRRYVGLTRDPRLREFLGPLDWNMPERNLKPAGLPCLRHLDRAANADSGTAEWAFVVALAANRNELCWGQTYTAAELGDDFLADYGWMELFGARGHFAHDIIAAGFLVLGPHTLYPDHHHAAEEIYVPLTDGTSWRKGEGRFASRRAGEVIHHPSNVSHAMRVGEEPLVALYFWRGGPLDQKSTLRSATG